MHNNNEHHEHPDLAEGENRNLQSDRVLKTDDPGLGEEGVVPNLSSRTVVGVFDSRPDAETVVREIEGMGIRSEDVSLVLQEPGSAAEIGTGSTHADAGMATGLTAGAVLGGLVGLAALAIPGIGPLLAAGPLAIALGAATGAALGGLVGAFTGLGIPKEEAERLDQAVRSGGVVVATTVSDREVEERVRAKMEQHGAREVGSYTQAL